MRQCLWKQVKLTEMEDKIEKPEPVYYYCGLMGGVDLSDQLLNYYSFLRKSSKWSRTIADTFVQSHSSQCIHTE